MTLNNNIRSLRLQKRLSQEALGEQLGVTAQAVSKWEQGITSPDISLLPHLAACFGVTIDCLFAGADTRRYPGYGSERAELLAIYEGKDGTEADFRRAADAYSEVILSGKATPEDYQSYGILHKIRAFRDIEIALHYYRRAIGQKDQAIAQYEEILVWLESHGYNMDLEGVYPRQRIREIQES